MPEHLEGGLRLGLSKRHEQLHVARARGLAQGKGVEPRARKGPLERDHSEPLLIDGTDGRGSTLGEGAVDDGQELVERHSVPRAKRHAPFHQGALVGDRYPERERAEVQEARELALLLQDMPCLLLLGGLGRRNVLFLGLRAGRLRPLSGPEGGKEQQQAQQEQAPSALA